jgi:hypothetical protein
LTRRYNEDIANGKWNHITDYKPGFRNGSSVFFEPITTRIENGGVQGIGVAIEGQSRRLQPEKGELPVISTRESVVSLAVSDAKTAGEIQLREGGEGNYLTWPDDGENRVGPGPGSWDAIPYEVASDTKAVFDFYFDAMPGGEHTLYLSVDHPDADSDSWWITFNDRAPVQTSEFVGKTQRLKVADVVLKPGWNSLTIHPRENGAKLYGVEFVQEARQMQVDFAETNRLPKFNQLTRQPYFIDIYALGDQAEEWRARSSVPWLELSKQEGILRGEAERIWITVNYDKAPVGNDLEGSIEILGNEQSYRVEVAAWNQNLPGPSNAFIEDNGVIAMPASGYLNSHKGRAASWRSLVGLGRSGSAMLLEPGNGWSVNDLGKIRSDCPALDYEIVVVEGGTAQVIVEAVPAFPLNQSQPLTCAVSIDDGDLQWITFDMGKDGSATWQTNVLESRMIGIGELQLPPGTYRFKLWGTDPSVNVDRILIDFGGLKPGYVGPRSTQTG